MPMEKRLRQVAAKIEAVEGVAETLTAAEAKFLVFDVISEPQSVPIYKRSPNRGTLSQLPGIPGPIPWKMGFKVELRGSGVKDTAPSLGVLLQGCNWAESVHVATDVTYDPASLNTKSLTMSVFDNGIIDKMKGARGNFKMTGGIGKPVIFEFEFQGVLDSQTDGSLLAGVTYETTVPPQFMGVNLTLDTWVAADLVFDNFTFDMGNKLYVRDSANAAGGLLSCRITDREPKGSIDPERVTKATYDVLSKLKAGTSMALSMTVGGISGNMFDITAPQVQFESAGDGDRNGLAVTNLGLAFAMSTGDDEIRIKQY